MAFTNATMERMRNAFFSVCEPPCDDPIVLADRKLAVAMGKSSAALLSQQLQDTVLTIEPAARRCLFGTDRALTQLRIQMHASRDEEAYFADDIVMTIPGVGEYHGSRDVVEYVNVLSKPRDRKSVV